MRRRVVTGVLVFALLLLWYVARYGDCTSYFFHFDDYWLLGDASRVRSVQDVFKPGRTAFFLYRPLSQIGYFTALRELVGYDAAANHAVHLLAHVCNAFLVYGIASIALRSGDVPESAERLT